MSIQKTNNQPSFTSEVFLTKGLKKVLNKQKTNLNREAIINLTKTIENDGLKRKYNFGYFTGDREGKNFLHGSLVDIYKRLTIQISETIEHMGKKGEAKINRKSTTKLDNLYFSNSEMLNEEVDNANYSFENATKVVKANINKQIAKEKEAKIAEKTKEAIKNIGKKSKINPWL